RTIVGGEISVRNGVARIALSPKLVSLRFLFQFSGNNVIIVGGNSELLTLADAIAQLVGFPQIFGGATGLGKVGILQAEERVGHRELRIEFDGTFHKGQSFGGALFARDADAHAERLQSFERGRGRFDGNVELLHRGERLAQTRAHRRGDLVKRLQHAFPAGSLALFFGERIAGVAVHGFKSDDILGAQAGNGSFEESFGPGAQANFAGDGRGNLVSGGAAHELKGLAKAAFGKNVDEGRLAQVYGQRLLQGIVENRLAGRVVKIGEDDGILFGEGSGRGWRPMCGVVIPAQRNRRQHERDESVPELAGWSGGWTGGGRGGDSSGRGAANGRGGGRIGYVALGRFFFHRNGGLAGFGFAEQTLQVRTHFRGVLVPEVAILLEGLINNVVELGRQVWIQTGRVGRFLVEDGIVENGGGVATKRKRAGCHFVEDGAEREQVGARVERLSAGLLG